MTTWSVFYSHYNASEERKDCSQPTTAWCGIQPLTRPSPEPICHLFMNETTTAAHPAQSRKRAFFPPHTH